MRLLNFALSTAAYGDTLIGLSFTDQIRRPGIEQHFVVSEAAVPLVSSVMSPTGPPPTITTLVFTLSPRVVRLSSRSVFKTLLGCRSTRAGERNAPSVRETPGGSTGGARTA